MVAPKLRFKEFDGDWSSQTLGNIAKFISGYAFDSEKFDENGRKLITPKNFTTYGRALFTEQNTKFTIESCDEKFVCRGNDLLILLTDLTQSCELLGKPILLPDLNEEILLNQRILKVEPNQDVIGKLFLLNFFLTENYLKHIKETSTGTTVRHSSHKILSKYEVFYPSKAEQTKIASFLSAVDEKISQLTQKHELLSQYKQGMMQKLFSQQLRFKADDGSEFGEWEETELGKHCQIKTGKLDANAMRPNGEFRFYTCAKEFYLIDEYAFDTEALLISGNGANVGYIHYYKGKFNAYQRTYVLDQWQQNIIFIQYFLEQFLKERIYGEKKEGNTPYIVLSTLSEMPLLLPCLAEQTKIANFLSAIDQKIEVVAQQIEQAKLWKKGLLQQMFV
jgi:type I restriction enzyme S subunit